MFSLANKKVLVIGIVSREFHRLGLRPLQPESIRVPAQS